MKKNPQQSNHQFRLGELNKKWHLLLFSFFFLMVGQRPVYGQGGVEFCFDSLVSTSNCIDYASYSGPYLASLSLDTITNPSNIWQIGAPQKPVLNSALGAPNVIITDTVNSYPINDTSSFIIKYLNDTIDCDWQNYLGIGFQFDFYVDSDTLTDFGKIEFSPDNGSTWIDLLDSPYAGLVGWHWSSWSASHYTPPVLTGSSGGWCSAFCSDMKEIPIMFGLQLCDTLTWRFSFISDAVQTNKDGLMFDNISIGITYPIGLEENKLNPNRTLLKIVDLMGRETKYQPNSTLIYIYSDGSREKVFKVE